MPVGDLGKPAFHADNGTAECAAAGRYSSSISIIKAVESKYPSKPRWQSVTPHNLGSFSAVCWYTGKALSDRFGGRVPVGLMLAAVGGSPIEYWLPPSSKPNINKCEVDRPQCDRMYNDSWFYTDIVSQYAPFTIGALVWDQAERDVKCPVSVAAYACMERELVSSWRDAFRTPHAPFVAVQLPGYTGALNNGTGSYSGYISAEMVHAMRLEQDVGTASLTNATAVPTYDKSCPHSPYGSVHNTEKGPIGERVAAQLYQMLRPNQPTIETPLRAVRATAKVASNGGYSVTVSFRGGSSPFVLGGTKNCTTCCDGSAPAGSAADGHTLDFDASATGGDGPWVNSTGAVVDRGTGSVTFKVTLSSRPALVRYTAASIFPQCALFNAERLPAMPFTIAVSEA